MFIHMTKRVGFYLRRDPDSGWVLKMWRWVVSFNVHRGARSKVVDLAIPSGGRIAGPEEDRIEAAYWRFDARHKGYGQWKPAPMSERDAFKAEMRNALEAERIRHGMRLAAQSKTPNV